MTENRKLMRVRGRVQRAAYGALLAAAVAGVVMSSVAGAASAAPREPIVCIRAIADDGKSVKGACFPAARGTSWRFVATVCGTSYCRTARSSWYPQDGRLRTWAPGGYIADVWFEFQ